MNNLLASYSFHLGKTVEIHSGDITEEKVDAIVNAANSYLQHGGTVARAIAEKGGKLIQSESNSWVQTHGAVSNSSPAITSAGRLPCKFVIHAVGPVWGSGDEENKLSQAIAGSLQLADSNRFSSIAFPAISTGIFGFPIELAASIFKKTISKFFSDSPFSSIKNVKIILFDPDTIEIFTDVFSSWSESELGKIE